MFFTTKHGISKRTPLSSFANIRHSGLIAVGLREDDELISVRLTDGHKQIVIGTKAGMMIRFPEEDVRSMGRTAAGVKGISLRANDEVVGMEILEENDEILVVTKHGYGKRTTEEEYRIQSRGGKGIKTCNITEKNGELVSIKTIQPEAEEDLMIITAAGVIIRMAIEDISKTGRSTQGVKLIRMGNEENEYVSTVAIVEREEEKEDLEEEDEQQSTESTSEVEQVQNEGEQGLNTDDEE